MSNVTNGDSARSSKYFNLYRRYMGIKSRCYNPNATGYERYGKVGIKMCDEWYYSFEKFKDWSLKNGYKKELSIDRIDSNGNYEPNNCRWVDSKVQHNNKRNNVIIDIDGVEKTIAQWSEIYGIENRLAYTRYENGRRGKELFKPRVFTKWSEEEKDYLKNNWSSKPISELAKELNRTEGAVQRMCHILKLRAHERIYAVVKHGEIIASGTSKEIMKQLNLKRKSFFNYQGNTWENKRLLYVFNHYKNEWIKYS